MNQNPYEIAHGERLRLEILPAKDLAEIDSQKKKLIAAQSELQQKISDQTTLAVEWNKQAQHLEEQLDALKNAEEEFRRIGENCEAVVVILEGRIGRFDQFNPAVHLATEIAKGRAILPIYEAALVKLRAKVSAEVESARAFGKANNIAQKYWPATPTH